MILRAVVCPGAPLLIPGLADGLSAGAPELISACDRAVEQLRAVDRVLLVYSGPGIREQRFREQHLSVVHVAGTRVSSAVITGTSRAAHFTGRLAGASADEPPMGFPAAAAPGRPRAADVSTGPPPGVGVVVGAALLDRAGITAPVVAVELAGPTAEVASLFGEAQASVDRVGLLVVAEGSAGRAALPIDGGAADAELLDASLAAALAAGNPAMLAAAAGVDQGTAARLSFTAGPALLALAALTSSHPPDRAELLLTGAPLGVGYLVAAWAWAG